MNWEENTSKEIISMIAAFEGDIVSIYQSHYSSKTFNKKASAVRKELADSIEQQIEKAKQEARQEFAKNLRETIFAEPCEPDCDEVRHARHEGEWNCYTRTNEQIDTLLAEMEK